MNRNNQSQQLKSPLPATHRDSPAYLHGLICESTLTKLVLVTLTSEPEPLTISLIAGTWCSLETVGDHLPDDKIAPGTKHLSERDSRELRHEPGTGHDCLVINTPAGVETELTVAQTAELIDKLEILLGKKQPAIIVPSIIPPNLKTQ